MSFAAPWVLLALAVLPLLWWLLRVTPPAPRREVFPAVRLLLGLAAPAETPAHTPWWLLALRLAAAALAIVALARPVLGPGAALPGSGPLLVVIDNGWAAAPDWPRRMEAAAGALDEAEREGRQVGLLATAPDATGAAPEAGPPMPPADARRRLAALRPQPWPVDRPAATAALAGWRGKGAAIYLADGTTGGTGWEDFAAALAAVGPVDDMRAAVAPARLMLPPRPEADRLVARIAQVPRPTPTEGAVLAQSGDGRTLARAPFSVPAGAGLAEAAIALPSELRNRLDRLVLEKETGAGAVALLDERWRRRPVGLLAGDTAGASTPLLGALFYLRRALAPSAELRQGSVAELLGRDLSVLITADWVAEDAAERTALEAWVDKGGLLVRFAGPHLAEHPDSLLPVALLAGDRQLGGAMSWGEPAGLAAFPPGSPFAGLAVPGEVRVTRQVLAEPGSRLAEASWARLEDGTPLVTQAPRGAGRIVLFHVTANAEWSDLPLSGLFVDMLRRLVAISAGVAVNDATGGPPLAPEETLDGFGLAGPPPPAAAAASAAELAAATVSPRHPPGLYGPESGRRALNLGNRMAPPQEAPPIAGARAVRLDAAANRTEPGPWLMALALALLALDLAISLPLRGLLGAGTAALMLAVMPLAHAAEPPSPALETRLAYVQTGEPALDEVSRAGLAGLSEVVNRRTAATLAAPAAVVPGRDDLSFYPLLYWPVAADTPRLPASAAAALNRFMANGGILVIDTRGTGSGAGFAPGAAERLGEIGQDLDIPPLTPLTNAHVLARAFYLLSDYPGRFVGGEVWVQRDQDRSNDSVSPVIIGGNDWAAAWATDASGRPLYATVPGGDRQRVLAWRFGVNLVMYALTGNYKGDQVHVSTLLERLGQ